MFRFLIADDHSLLRQALELNLRRCWPDAEIVNVSDYPTAWDAAIQPFDLCICDLSMPGATPADGIGRLLSIQPAMRIVAITGSADDNALHQIRAMNITAILSKTAEPVHVEEAIRHALSGGKAQRASAAQAPVKNSLTVTQQSVLGFMCKGHTNKEIAQALDIAPSTVKTHVDNILLRLGVRNRTEACQKFNK